MYKTFLVLYLIIAITLIVLIMLQQNKGNDLGGIFSNRSLGDMLNLGNFNTGINRLIVVLAILFFLFSLLLGNMNSKQNKQCVHNNIQDNQHQEK